MWTVDKLPVPAANGSDPHAAEREAMWAAIKAWQNVSSGRVIVHMWAPRSI